MHLGDNGGNSVSANQNGASPTSSTGPIRYCDLVMKGGVTSGIVYPAAVAALKDVYTFKNIGGTSAGAMAAAATAAAEFARRNGNRSGFEELERFHKWLAAKAPSGGHSNLFSMFQPDRATRPIYDVLVAGLGPRRFKYTRMIARVLWAFWGFALLVSVPGLLLLGLSWWFLTSGPPEWRPYGWAVAGLGLLLAAAGALSGGGARLCLACESGVPRERLWPLQRPRHAAAAIMAQFREEDAARRPDRLADLLPEPARRPARERPPADLRRPLGLRWRCGPRDPVGDDGDQRHPLPSPPAARPRPGFLVRRQGDAQAFPEPVVAWMEQHPDPSVKNPESFTKMGLRPMPAPADLPLVVARG